MSRPRLQRRLDEAAEHMLDRVFPQPPKDDSVEQQPVKEAEIEHQIRTFEAVVKYYGPRTKLGGKDDEKESEFGNLRDRLHGKHRRKATRRRTSAEVDAAYNGTNGTANEP